MILSLYNIHKTFFAMNLIEDLHKIEKGFKNLKKLIFSLWKYKSDQRNINKCINKINSMLFTLDSTQNLLKDAKYKLTETLPEGDVQ